MYIKTLALESLSDVVEIHLNVFHMVEQGNEFILAVLHIIHEMRHAIFHGYINYHVQWCSYSQIVLF